MLPAKGRSGVGQLASLEADTTRDLHNAREGQERAWWLGVVMGLGGRGIDAALTSSSTRGFASSGSTRPTAFRASSSSWNHSSSTLPTLLHAEKRWQVTFHESLASDEKSRQRFPIPVQLTTCSVAREGWRMIWRQRAQTPHSLQRLLVSHGCPLLRVLYTVSVEGRRGNDYTIIIDTQPFSSQQRLQAPSASQSKDVELR